MKRKLNILCAIVLLALSYSVIETTYYIGMGMSAGIKSALTKETNPEEMEKISNMKVIHLLPEDLIGNIFLDSIYNEKSDEYVPVSYTQAFASIDTQPSLLLTIGSRLVGIADLVTIIWAVVLFIRLIVAINRSIIFNWKNVRRLRCLGILLIINFSCTLFTTILDFHNIKEVFAISGYSLVLDDVHTMSLVLGLSALIVAEIFSISLKMKEEQDLTI